MKDARVRQSSGSALAAIAVLAGAAVLMLGQAAPAAAHESVPTAAEYDRVTALESPIDQARTAEPRWLAWIGCWDPVTAPLADADASAPAERVCVLPGESIDEIRILTLEGDEVVLTTPIHADGTRRDVRRAGCSGLETASWSADGRRILLHSDLDCEGGLRRVSSGILAMLPGGEWLDIQAIESGSEEATRVVRHRPAPVPDALAADFGSILDERRLAIQTARSDAALSLTLEDVSEAVEATNAKTVTALLVERGEGFDVEAGELVAMRRAGVPGDVTDLVVALSFPDRFTIDGPGGSASLRPQEAELGGGPGYEYARGRRGSVYNSCLGYGYDPYGFSPYSLFGSGYGWSSGFGCSPFAYGGRYGWYGGSRSPIVIIQDNEREPAPSGRMIRGEGYRGDGSVGNRGGRRAAPRTSRNPERSSSPPPRSTVGRRGSPSSSPPASSSGSSGRRAKRKKGGGS